VEIRSAHPADVDRDEDLSRAGLRARAFDDAQRRRRNRSGLLEDERASHCQNR